jgi:hypothetical protein
MKLARTCRAARRHRKRMMIAFADCPLLTGIGVMMTGMISTSDTDRGFHNANQWVEPIASRLVSKMQRFQLLVLANLILVIESFD